MRDHHHEDGRSTEQQSDTDDVQLSRRSVLSAIGAGATGLALGGGVDTAGASAPSDSPAADFAEATTATTRATSDGTWSGDAVWSDGEPGPRADVRIDSGVSVTLAGETEPIKTLVVEGALSVAPDTDTHLRAETIVTTPGSTLEIGTEERPIQPDSTARLTFVHHEDIHEKDIDPERISKGLVTMGQLDVHGAEKTSWDELSTAPEAGDRRIELADEPTGWQEDDDIVVPAVEPNAPDQDEEREIADVSGTTVTLDEPLSYDHVPPENNLDVDLSAYALNLSRNVVLESAVQVTDVTREAAVNRQPHVMVMQPAQTLEYVRLVHLGRTNKRYSFTDHFFGKEPDTAVPDRDNPLARYALHFHMTGLGADPHEVTGVVAQNSPGWGIVNHYSHVDVRESITYQVYGAGFVSESGPERGSFERCFALRSRGSPKRGSMPTREGYKDFGHEGNGFWFQGPGVAIDDCVAAGHAGYGYAIWGVPLYNHPKFDDPGGPNYPADLAIEDGIAPAGAEPGGAFNSQHLPLKSFSDNVAVASGGGLDYGNFDGYHGSRTAYDQFSLVDTFTVYNVGPFVDENGESLYPRGNGNLWGEGGKCAVAQRYADGLLVSNPQFCNNGVGGGHGIRRNFYPRSGATEGGVIEGFDTGVHTIDAAAEELIRGVTFLDTDHDVWVTPVGDPGGQRIYASDLDFSESGGLTLNYSQNHTLVYSLFDDDSRVYLDGRLVYYDAMDPEYVPFERPADIDRLLDPDNSLGNNDRFFGIPRDEIDERVPGMTNAELAAEFGMNVLGILTPDDAVDVPVVNGGTIDPIGVMPESPAPGDEIRFDGDRYRDGASYEWAFDDGTTATGPTVTHTYDESGVYQVELRVERPDGETETYTEGIEVVPDGPVVTPEKIFPAEPVTLNGAAYDDLPLADSYQWDIDGGPALAGAVVTHAFAEGGDYEVELTATMADGETHTRTETVTVEPWYSPAEPGPVSNGVTFEVSDHNSRSEPSGVTDQIDLEPVGNDPYFEDITYDGYVYVPASGNYELTVEANNDATVFVGDDEIVSADTGASSSRIAMGAGLHPIRVEYTEYAQGQTLRVALDGPGMSGEIATDHLYVQDEDGQVVRPDPTARFTPTQRTATVGDDIVFDGGDSLAPQGRVTSYEWEFGDGETATGETVAHSYAERGQYRVTLTVGNDAGGTDRTTKTVTVGDASEEQSPYGRETGWPVPGRIQAEDYDEGTPGLASRDESVGNIGGAYRDGQVDVGTHGDGDHHVGWMHADEWLEYTVDVASAGRYDLRLRVASPHSDTELGVRIGGTDHGTVDVPQTGGWESYTTVVLPDIELDSGRQVVRLSVADTGGAEYAYNLDWFEFGSPDDSSLAAAIDEDDDGTIGNGEILDALDYWETGETVSGTGGEVVDDEDILRLVDMWENETEIGTDSS